MISIIIVSANADLLVDVSANVNKTVGVEYEIISFDNANAGMGICEVYNKGIEKAKYDIICFMHEDIYIKTENWGQIVRRCFDTHSKLGLLGIAGGRYKTLSPSSWYIGSDVTDRYQLLQHFKFRTEESKIDFMNPDNEKLSLVSTVDGVWFCARKEALMGIRFDDELLKGFHGYDVDFSLSVGQKWDVAVTFEILLEHFSEGNYDRKWIKSAMLVHKKWNKILPKKSINSLSKNDCIDLECKAFETFIYAMVDAGYAKRQMYSILWNSRLYRFLGWKNYYKMYRFISSLKTKGLQVKTSDF